MDFILKTPGSLQSLSFSNRSALLFIKFTLNFNEALLVAEISQTFFKFMGITLLSSTIIWFIPLLLYILIAPFYGRFFLFAHSRINLSVMSSLIALFFCNSVAFSFLHYLETLAANQVQDKSTIVLLGIFAFTIIDFSKMVFDFSLLEFLCQNLEKKDKSSFRFWEITVGEIGKISGGLISCLYILQQKTASGRFSENFYTNIQFCYFSAGILNAITFLVVFCCWPKNLVGENQFQFSNAEKSYLSNLFPGFQSLLLLNSKNKKLALRKFLVIGIYYSVTLSLTQWVSNLFSSNYSYSLANSPMQILDIGTSWGSLALTVYFCINSVQILLSYNFANYFRKIEKWTTRGANFIGGIMLLLAYYYYNGDIKIVMLFFGLSGLGHDVFLSDRITEQFKTDESVISLRGYQKRKTVEELGIFLEVLAYFAFVFLFPVFFFAVNDCYWVLATALIYLILGFLDPVF